MGSSINEVFLFSVYKFRFLIYIQRGERQLQFNNDSST